MIVWLMAAAFALPPDQVAEVAEAAGMEVAEVEAALAGLDKRQEVLDAMATPWERKPWHQYAPIFLTDERTAKGKAFAEAHADLLAKAEETYGVPAEVIVAILGVESKYGERMGDHPVLDCLFTLGFFHERRGGFFRTELGHYLRLSADEGWTGKTGSYAGAMGMAQFIPSSYRHYAVDFDGDGHRDLFGSPADAIGSIGNYLAEHGWKGGPVLVDARVTGDTDGLVDTKLDLAWTVAELKSRGVEADAPSEAKARLFAYETESGTEYKLGLHDFYVITRYNHSALYARVVWELSERIAAE